MNLNLYVCLYFKYVKSILVVSCADIHNENDDPPKTSFSLEEAYYQLYTPSHFNGTWHSDKEIFMFTRTIKVINIETGKTRLIMNESDIPVRIQDLLCNLTFEILSEIDISLSEMLKTSSWRRKLNEIFFRSYK